MVEAFGEFFDLPVEERKVFKGKKVFDPIRHENGFTATEVGEQNLRNYLRIFVHPTLHRPSKPVYLRSTCEEYARQIREIIVKLLSVVGESLGLEEDYMEKTLDLENGHQILVGNLYPQSQQPEPSIAPPSHSDTPLLSLVMQNGTVEGLEVFHDGHWVSVQLIPGSLFIHTGDLLEIVSNARYRSLLHRVILNRNSTRLSVVTALGVPIENVLSCA